MSVKIRLARCGRKKRPQYRIVVANSSSPRDGKFIEVIGRYHPLLSDENAERIVVNLDRFNYWESVGAIPTDKISYLVKKIVSK